MIIRTDASSSVGFGHAMRCLALAQAAVEEGWETRLIYAECPDSVLENYQDVGTKLLQYCGRKHGEEDALFMSDLGAEWVVNDGYWFSQDFYRAVREYSQLLCIDDAGRPEVLLADVILNQNAASKLSWYSRRQSHCRLLRGVEYILLRKEFQMARFDRTRSSIRNIVLTTGGTDTLRVTVPIVESLVSVVPRDCQLNILIGASNKDPEHIIHKTAHMDNVACLYNVNNMAQVLGAADLVITGAGSTVWECLALRVPFVTMTLADNQNFNAKYLAEKGLAPMAGIVSEAGFIDRVMSCVLQQISDPPAAISAAERGKRLIDGRGADRVLASL